MTPTQVTLISSAFIGASIAVNSYKHATSYPLNCPMLNRPLFNMFLSSLEGLNHFLFSGLKDNSLIHKDIWEIKDLSKQPLSPICKKFQNWFDLSLLITTLSVSLLIKHQLRD